LSLTVGNGNNTIVLGVDTGANAQTITVGTGTNTITLGASHPHSATNVTFGAANASSTTSFTTITNIGGTLSAIPAGANYTAAAAALGDTTITLNNAGTTTGLAVGMIVRDTTTAAALGGASGTTRIASISGAVITLDTPVAATLNLNDRLSFGFNGGASTDNITFRNNALNTNVFNLGSVSSISAGLSGASTTQGYTTFSVGTTQYLYEFTGAASTSELVALTGIGHTFTPNANLVNVLVLS